MVGGGSEAKHVASELTLVIRGIAACASLLIMVLGILRQMGAQDFGDVGQCDTSPIVASGFVPMRLLRLGNNRRLPSVSWSTA